MNFQHYIIKCFFSVAIALTIPSFGKGDFIVPGTTGADNKLDVGFFTGGTELNLNVTGSVNLIPQTGEKWITNPDGSLISFTDPFTYRYALEGSINYPAVYGGDGINHFAGGGANYDTATGTPYGHFGFAGKETTDTTDPMAIRFGAIVYTFYDNPTHDDWNLLGFGSTIIIPDGGTNLYFAINDSNSNVFPGANSGQYVVDIKTVPEPSSWALLLSGFATLSGLFFRKIFHKL